MLEVGLNAHVLIHFLHLEILWFWSKVRQHYSVHAEHSVVGPVTVVTSVAHIP